jgi:hypothetical protein
MMRGKEGTKMTSVPKINWLEHGQLERMVRLEKLPAFKGLTETVESSEVGQWKENSLNVWMLGVCCHISLGVVT